MPPETSDREISWEKKIIEKGGKWRRKEGKSVKGKVENWKWKESSKFQNEERTFFLFIFFSFFSFSFLFFLSFFLFFFAFHFSKRLKFVLEFVLGVPKWKFSTRKKVFHAGKNQEK